MAVGQESTLAVGPLLQIFHAVDDRGDAQFVDRKTVGQFMMVAVVPWHFAHALPGVPGVVAGFQFEMSPSRVANAKLLLVGLEAVPVGLPAPVPMAGGTVTAKPTMVPLA